MSKTTQKTLSPEAQKRKELKEKISKLKEDLKATQKELIELTPIPNPKAKTILTETMKLAQSIHKKVEDKTKNPSKAELRAQCSKITGFETDKIPRSSVEKLAKECLALLEVLEKEPQIEEKPIQAK